MGKAVLKLFLDTAFFLLFIYSMPRYI